MKKDSKHMMRWMSILLTVALLFGSLADIGVALADEAPTDTPASQEGMPTEEPTAEPTGEPTAEPSPEPSVTPPPKEVEEPVAGPPLLSEAMPPTPASPNGVIYNNTPTYSWNPVIGATHFFLYVYRVSMTGDIKIIDMNFSASSICNVVTDTCSVRPATGLALGNYKWRVIARANEIWGEPSEWQTFSLASTTVTSRLPNGITYTNPPTFTWREIVGAEKYQIQVYNSKKVLVAQQIFEDGDFDCDELICSVESEWELANGKHTWRIRAWLGSKWYAYSSLRSFVVTPEIDSDFSGFSSDWKPFGGGIWTLSGGKFWTNGLAGRMTSARSAFEYNNFEFEAVVKREPSTENVSFPANYIAVRMGSGRLKSNKIWYPGYLFGYTNAGNFSVWRMNANGTATALQPWTDSDSVKPDDWNKLGVIADGSSLQFFINDDQVFEVTNSRFSQGFVGFMAYKSGPADGAFQVDTASVTTQIELENLSGAGISPQQAALNLAAASSPAVGSLEGFTMLAEGIGVPEPEWPIDVIYNTRPRFFWSTADGFPTHYQLVLERINDVDGFNRVFGRTYIAATICGPGDCVVLSPSTLRNGEYRWKVRASADGGKTWGGFSDNTKFRVASPIPKQVSPKGTIYDETRPDFEWTEINGATQYRIEIWNRIGPLVTSRVFKVGDDFECGDGNCWAESPVTFRKGIYMWRVRAFYNGVWRPFSGMSVFTIGDLINSDFKSNSTGWSNLFGGTWARSSSGPGTYSTSGLANKFTSTRYAYEYRDFEFTTLVWRESTSTSGSQPANFIGVRMGSLSKGTEGAWYGGYLFGYTNAGEFSIWRMSTSGSAHAIQPWTHSDAIVKNGWNELKVVADGSDFEFFINGTPVHSFMDTTYKQGYIGFQMYQPAGTTSRFWVDYAYLDLIDLTSMAGASSAQIEPQQLVLNQEALVDLTPSSIEGTP